MERPPYCSEAAAAVGSAGELGAAQLTAALAAKAPSRRVGSVGLLLVPHKSSRGQTELSYRTTQPAGRTASSGSSSGSSSSSRMRTVEAVSSTSRWAHRGGAGGNLKQQRQTGGKRREQPDRNYNSVPRGQTAAYVTAGADAARWEVARGQKCSASQGSSCSVVAAAAAAAVVLAATDVSRRRRCASTDGSY
ncbi:uncharacterized protein LOC126419377 [Schistocerca serialis cubense]|uniref:uncharacterized protein LOC126419377 n=1 Tax=Schistocerca serialis cubense TaxID=2023355 RepID=UPI00214E190C|nr:uncharacterized protein LOC126419377 [Schistocerca serialis cubense]